MCFTSRFPFVLPILKRLLPLANRLKCFAIHWKVFIPFFQIQTFKIPSADMVKWNFEWPVTQGHEVKLLTLSNIPFRVSVEWRWWIMIWMQWSRTEVKLLSKLLSFPLPLMKIIFRVKVVWSIVVRIKWVSCFIYLIHESVVHWEESAWIEGNFIVVYLSRKSL